ncbi:MAG: hypothetical protein K8L99_00470 [Anaerolineae bacterium]|nr:hypothetical protein [Anaerolineae bacterium]
MTVVKRSPMLLVLLVGMVLLLVMVLRGLDYGPLQTDVIIFRSWAKEVGIAGLSARFLESNQRHLLSGPMAAAAMTLFGEWDPAYNFILLLSRVLEGVFLAGIVYQFARQRLLAVCAGLAVIFSLTRMAELFQQVTWGIEPTLVLLLASAYCYLLFLRNKSPQWLWYSLFVILYAISILRYESGLPWIAVNLLIAVLIRDSQPFPRRLWLALRDSLATLFIGGFIAVLVLYILTPWGGLAPDSGGVLSRFVTAFFDSLNLWAVIRPALAAMRTDGYTGLLVVSVLAAGGLLVLLARWLQPASAVRHTYVQLIALSLVMLASSLLIAASGADVVDSYFNRIAFGRVIGISLLYVSLIFGLCALLPLRQRNMLAAGLTGLLLVGPGVSGMLAWQDYAHQTWDEIQNLKQLIVDERWKFGPGVHLVIWTEPDWPGARFHDAADVVVFELQQELWAAGADATTDILHTGAYRDEYVNIPGTCEAAWGEASAGMCLADEVLISSRWAFGEHPYENVVLVRYDHHAHTMTPWRSVPLDRLMPDYNITTAGRSELESSPDKVTVDLQGFEP